MQPSPSRPSRPSRPTSGSGRRSVLGRSTTKGPLLLILLGLAGLSGVGTAFGLGARAFSAWEPGMLSPDTTTIFGPKLFQAKPNTAIYVEQFTEERDLQADYLLWIENGAPDGSGRVSHAEISLNGVTVLAPGNITTSDSHVVRGLSLQDGVNTLEVRIKDHHSRHLTARVLRVLSEPRGIYDRRFQKETGDFEVFTDHFSLPATAAPPHRLRIEYNPGWTYTPQFSVHVNGDMVLEWFCPWCGSMCEDSPDGTSTECAVQLLPENDLEVRMSGQVDAAVRVIFTAVDTAGPVLTLDSPTEGLVTNAGAVEVAGTVEADNLPVTLMVDGDTIPVSGGAFSTTVVLALEGENAIHLVARDAAENTTELTRVVIRDTHPPVLDVSAPEDGLVTSHGSVVVAGTVQDLTEVDVNVNGIPLVVDGAGSFSGEVLLDEGENFLTITATDQAGNSTTAIRHVTLTGSDTDPPVLLVTEPAEGLATAAEMVWVRGTVTDASPVTLTVNGADVPVHVDDSFEHEVSLVVGPNTIVVVATDAAENVTTVTRNVTREAAGDPDLPPDPGTVAPELDGTVSTTMHAATDFLYTGDDPIQTGVEPGTINPVRVSVIRGRVLTRESEPLPGVTITVLDHPELGQTKSRADGAFDLAVNGGGSVTLTYEKSGFLPAQRSVDAPWQDFAHAEDVVLIGLDAQVTVVSPATATDVEVARGSVQTDADGSRQATVLFKPGTEAEMVLPDGTRQPLSAFSVRATEYTVGPNAQLTAPASLPASTQFAYGMELSVDEAMASGAKTIEFSQPVAFYVENFPDMPVGTAVPIAFHDAETGWVPSRDGRIIRILDVAGGVAEIDIDGDTIPNTEAELAALGIDAAERQVLATLYTAGQSVWRVEVTHFSPWWCGWPYNLPPDAAFPDGDTDSDDDEDCPDEESMSVIECQNQVLGQRLPVSGTPFTLNYRTSRVAERVTPRRLEITLSREAVPESLRRIDLRIEVAGQVIEQSFDPVPDQSATFTWDGLDAYGRLIQGGRPVNVYVGWVFDYTYTTPAPILSSFGTTSPVRFTCLDFDDPAPPSTDFGCTYNRVPPQRTLWQVNVDTLHAWDTRAQLRIGGWSLSPHHGYDPVGLRLYRGDGERKGAENLNRHVSTAAGTGVGTCGYWNTDPNCQGDGGPARDADMALPMGVATGPDGSVYFAEWDGNRVRRVTPDGIITTVAGNGDFCNGFWVEYDPVPCGDNVPATQASLSFPHGIAVAPDGTLYIVETYGFRIRRVGTDGIITTIAGQNVWCFGDAYPECGDGGPATDASLSFYPTGLALGPDGSLYLADAGLDRVRRIGPDGTITTIAGVSGQNEWIGDGGPATEATIWWPEGIAAGRDGTVYVTDESARVRKVTPDGVITTIAGSGATCSPATAPCGDGGPAVEADLYWWLGGLAVDPGNNVYVSMTGADRIRRISADGIITTHVGTGIPCTGTSSCGDGGYAGAAGIDWPHGLAFAPDGSLYIADTFASKIRRVGPALPSFTDSELAVASEDGSALHHFDNSGRHLRTFDLNTGAALIEFGYDPEGLLATVTDADNLVTVIERDPSGTALAVVGPFGQRTELTMGVDGYLSQVMNPAGETVGAQYTPGGLMTGLTDARGHSRSYDFGPLGRLIQAQDAAAGSKGMLRTEDEAGYEVSFETAMGRTTVYRVEALSAGGQRRVTTGPDGLPVITTTDISGRTSVQLPDGTSTTRVRVGDPRFGIQTPIVDELTVTTPGGLALAGSGSRNVTIADQANPLSLITQLDTVRINGRVSTSLYDASLRRFANTTPAGRQSFVSIDAVGRVIEEQIPGIAATGYAYDAQGFMTQVTQGARTWTYGYDALGRLASVTDPLARTDSLFYDAADRLVRQVLPNGSEILYGYDANGNLSSLTPPARPAHGFAYNAVDLDSIYSPPAAGAGSWATEYRYNPDRQITEILRPDGQGAGFSYDAAGRLETLNTPVGAYSYGYHPTTGQLASVSAPGGGTLTYGYDGSLPLEVALAGPVTGSVAVRYDNNFWITAQKVNGDSVPFGYDTDGLLTSAGALSIARNAQNGLITGSTLGSLATRWTYNGFGELGSDTARHGSTVLYRNAYTRDDLGRITGKVETIDGVATTYAFAYDSIGRLVEVVRDGTPVESYTYDPNGNRLSFTGPGGTLVGSYDDQDRLLSYGDATYEYTANGELTSRTTPAGITTYDYDFFGNLRTLALPDGTAIEYVIDGQNRRVGKRVNGTLVQGFLYQDQLNPVAELDGSGQVVSRFVYGTRPHVPDYMVQGGVTYRIVTDHLGSVRLVVNTSTGAIAQRIDYDAFGRVTQDSDPGFQPFGFAGGIKDTHTDLVRFGVRDYDPYSGRWTSKDPILFAGGSSNLYAYALEDPINVLDPDGFQGLIGAVIGGGIDLGIQLWENGGQLRCVNLWRVGAAAALGALGAGLTPTGSLLGRGGQRAAQFGYNNSAGIINRGATRFGWSGPKNGKDVLSLRIGSVHKDIPGIGVKSGANRVRDGAAGGAAGGAANQGFWDPCEC